MSRRPPTASVHLDAVLFDMDGLLVDTEPLWYRAETAVVTELGGEWSKQHQRALLGSNLDFAADYMVRHTGSPLPVDEVAVMLRQAMSGQLADGVRLRPGAETLIGVLVEHEVRLGLVTSSVREHLDVVRRFMPDDVFEVTVCADDVERLKPHPDPYLRALELLEVAAGRTVVLEDSPAGVLAGEAAGCTVVAVPSVVDIEPREGRRVVRSLSDVDLRTLTDLVTRS